MAKMGGFRDGFSMADGSRATDRERWFGLLAQIGTDGMTIWDDHIMWGWGGGKKV